MERSESGGWEANSPMRIEVSARRFGDDLGSLNSLVEVSKPEIVGMP